MDNPLEKYPELRHPPVQPKDSSQNWLKILGIVVVACAVSTLVAVTAVYFYLFPGPFKPVTLSSSEEQVLEQKLERLDSMQRTPSLHKDRLQPDLNENLQPERYTETNASREVTLTEPVAPTEVTNGTCQSARGTLTCESNRTLLTARSHIDLSVEAIASCAPRSHPSK